MRNLWVIILTVSILMISACVPVMRDYYQPQHDGGKLFSTSCGGGAADSLRVQLPYEAYFTIEGSSSTPSKFSNFYLLLTYNLPEKVDLLLRTKDIVVSSDGVEVARFQIEKWLSVQDMDTEEISASKIIQGETINISSLFGGRDYYKGYSVSLSDDLPKKYESFTITLPELSVNDTIVKSKKINFVHKNKLGIDALNC